MPVSVILSDFTPMRLGEGIPQETLLRETANVFALVQCAIQKPESQEAANRILIETREMVRHYGVSAGYIKQRQANAMENVEITDEEDDIYPDILPRPLQQPRGLPISERMEKFRKAVNGLLEQHYADCGQAPDDIIHVSCTGYMSPSPVQQFTVRNHWNNTIVTHNYHMGCYAAFPAVRSAQGFMAGSFALGRPKSRIDIFHTEYCSLHLNFHRLTPNNIVNMTLFADGFMCYSAFSQDSFDAGRQNGLEILSMAERLIPDSEQEMTWDLGENYFEMNLSPAVPFFIAEHIRDFVESLVAMAGYKLGDIKDDLLFAVHPGGPKILEHIRKRFQLAAEQMRFSWEILYENGNMSSVTVPYIWHAITCDDTIPKGKLVLSMAFGPGLTACGMLMEKV
uniref:Predicted naringenin-chalcone synthase n=1 Tax=Candidatus Kentrum sp. FW TaxID=2126338 RepID=A0A450U0Q9_9GAMM|nr:MAG: Predicted naringenin-chalcone synthase [Candidatus Kentron sp. FW]